MIDRVASAQDLGEFGGFKLLFMRHPLPAWLFDAQSLDIIAANAAATTLYGYSEAEFLRLNMLDILFEDEVGPFLRSIEPRAPPAAGPRRWRHKGRDGRSIVVESEIEHLAHRGERLILAIVQSSGRSAPDLRRHEVAPVYAAADELPMLGEAQSAIRDKEVAEIRSRTKAEFLGRLSHELRTPLNAVIGFSELLALQEGHADPNQARYLEHILDAGRHLLSLVDDVLDLQRVEERRLPLMPRPVELAGFVSAETTLLLPLLAKLNITMHNQVPAGLVIFADERCLRQVLLNLATNAIKYNRPCGVVRWTASVVRPGFAVLMISDTGHGMSVEQMPRLFQPFDRLGRETSVHGGTGLGLLIAKGLVEHMGGSLVIESKAGVGTQVLVELPLAEPHSLFGDLAPGAMADPGLGQASIPDVPRGVQASAQSNLMPTIRLLYVEDNRINAMLFEAVLGARQDIELRIAETGWEALDIVEHWTPDVLVLDANLPDIHGIRLLRQMREFESLTKTPAFMCSADAMEEDVRLAREAGFVDYWTKPVDFNKVLDDLRRITLGARAAEGS